MKHSAQMVTLSAQRLAYGSMPLKPAETRPGSNFPERGNAFSKVRSLMPGTDYFGETALKVHIRKFKGFNVKKRNLSSAFHELFSEVSSNIITNKKSLMVFSMMNIFLMKITNVLEIFGQKFKLKKYMHG